VYHAELPHRRGTSRTVHSLVWIEPRKDRACAKIGVNMRGYDQRKDDEAGRAFIH